MIAVARCCAWCLLARFMCTLAVAPPCGPVDCNDINRCWGRRTSQVVAPNPLTLRCNHWTDGGGWTILQQRRSRYVDFYRTCAEYKRGFGTADTFWLGLDNLYRLTKNHESQLRVEVTFGRFRTVWFAEYDGVTFGNETAFYALNYSSYNGRGGLEDGLRNHAGHFCCSDSPASDRCRRLAMYGRTAWWFGEGRPFSSDLNAVLNSNFQRHSVYWIGVPDISFTRIMFRPSRFRRVTCDKSCPNGGTCIGAANGTFHCRCAPYHKGRRCEVIDASYEPPCGPVDCNDINRCWGLHPSKQKVFAPTPLTLRCDSETDGGGWTILQQRHNPTVEFYRTCAEYKRGFGTADTFWLGLDNLYRLTKNHKSQLRVELTHGGYPRTHYAEYDGVTFGNETAFYALNYSVYSGRGQLEDGLRDSRRWFCCKDSPNGRCRQIARYAHTGWWFGYDNDMTSDLNAMLETSDPQDDVYWYGAGDIFATQIKFRPSRSGLGNCDKSCPNGGTCIGVADGTFHCRCAPGHKGRRCEVIDASYQPHVDERNTYRFKSWGTIAGLVLVIAFLVVLLVLTGFYAYRRLFAADHDHDEQEQLLHD